MNAWPISIVSLDHFFGRHNEVCRDCFACFSVVETICANFVEGCKNALSLPTDRIVIRDDLRKVMSKFAEPLTEKGLRKRSGKLNIRLESLQDTCLSRLFKLVNCVADSEPVEIRQVEISHHCNLGHSLKLICSGPRRVCKGQQSPEFQPESILCLGTGNSDLLGEIEDCGNGSYDRQHSAQCGDPLSQTVLADRSSAGLIDEYGPGGEIGQQCRSHNPRKSPTHPVSKILVQKFHWFHRAIVLDWYLSAGSRQRQVQPLGAFT
ncbi:hypothetical protein BSY16_3989 [Sinorhizobium sp. RAC02]|nr:hypothetical protein BSY16_3989 [Sinorhizobium sp. RAC02]